MRAASADEESTDPTKGASMRRKDREQSEEFGWNVLETCPYAVLSTTDDEGTWLCEEVCSPTLKTMRREILGVAR